MSRHTVRVWTASWGLPSTVARARSTFSPSRSSTPKSENDVPATVAASPLTVTAAPEVTVPLTSTVAAWVWRPSAGTSTWISGASSSRRTVTLASPRLPRVSKASTRTALSPSVRATSIVQASPARVAACPATSTRSRCASDTVPLTV